MKPIVNLTGYELRTGIRARGNRYLVMSLCTEAAREASWPNNRIETLLEDLMVLYDYSQLMEIVRQHFEVT